MEFKIVKVEDHEDFENTKIEIHINGMVYKSFKPCYESFDSVVEAEVFTIKKAEQEIKHIKDFITFLGK